jgi:hypothetical protein
MLVLPFSGKQTFAHLPRLERPILPSPLNAPGERLVGLSGPDACIRAAGDRKSSALSDNDDDVDSNAAHVDRT